MERRCSRCQAVKTEDDFAGPFNSKARKDTYCRPCRAAYGREHYSRNRQSYIDQALRRTQRELATRVDYLMKYLTQHPCSDCGETDPLVLEFDHLSDKSFGIAGGLRYRSWDLVLAEIEKCEVACANCHRRRTAIRAGSSRYLWMQRREGQQELFN